MAEELKVRSIKQWHDFELVPGAAPKLITKVRVWIGEHGPFEKSFPSDVETYVIEEWVRSQKDALARLHQL